MSLALSKLRTTEVDTPISANQLRHGRLEPAPQSEIVVRYEVTYKSLVGREHLWRKESVLLLLALLSFTLLTGKL